MKEALLGKLVLVLSRATPEELAAVYHFATGQTSESAECEVRSTELKRKSPYVFRKVGSHWRVVFEGSAEFHLDDTLGARYLDYILHRPNQAVSAFDPEVAIQPEKGEARSRNSVQSKSDARAQRDGGGDSGGIAQEQAKREHVDRRGREHECAQAEQA